MKKLLALLLAVMLVCSLVACGSNEDTISKEYQEIIDDFIEGDDTEITLVIGKEHRAQGAHNLDGKLNLTYNIFSSDENVVNVSPKGKVTAISEGTAYVIIAEKLPILGIVDYDCTKYTVVTYDTVARNADIAFWNSDTLLVGETLSSASPSAVYSTDQSVIAISDNGAVMAVGPGVARVVYDIGSSQNVYEYTVYSDQHDKLIAEEEIPTNEAVVSHCGSNPSNCLTLTAGETYTVNDFFASSYAYKYSTDDTVATVSKDCVITAVGEGTAYIILADSNSWFDAYKVTVTKP